MTQPNDTSVTKKVSETKDWTLMFYFASDNPLAPGIVSQLKSIKDAGFHPDANIIARFDPHGSVMPTHVFEVNLIRRLKAEGLSQVGPPASDPYVRNLVTDKLWGEETASFSVESPTAVGGKETRTESIRDYIIQTLKANHRSNGTAPPQPDMRAFAQDNEDEDEDLDDSNTPIEYNPPVLPDYLTQESSPSESLANFLRFCREDYPARHYILFILGHGVAVGNDLFLYDENVSGTSQAPQAVQNPAGQNGTDSKSTDSEGTDSEETKFPPSQALPLTNLGTILNEFSGRIKKSGSELELVSFHSCSMSSLEVAYEIGDAANYMLASQGPAFVGSWPYRQIVMRVFNNLNCPLTADDLEDPASLAQGLKDKTGPVYEMVNEWTSKTGTDISDLWMRLSHHNGGSPRDTKLTKGMVRALNGIIGDPQMYEGERFQTEALTALMKPFKKERPKNFALMPGDVRRLNRQLFAVACPGVVHKKPQINVKKMLKSILYYCLYNSFDYQLAGYSFDAMLCDLRQVKHLEKPLRELTAALCAGLESSDQTAQGLILLSHWESQSFWQENYTDLYDFCLRLYTRCRDISPASDEMKKIVREIKRACFVMIKALTKETLTKDYEVPLLGEGKAGEPKDPDLEGLDPKPDHGSVIIHADFAGPAYQYSHGFSIYFPWAEPVASPLWSEQYHTYRLNQDMRNGGGKSWRCFLKKYFDATMRKTRAEEDSKTQRPQKLRFERELLEVIATEIFDEYGQLSRKTGANDPMGGPKIGGNDPTGDSSSCSVIKNYPTVSRRRRQATTTAADGNGDNLCETPQNEAEVKTTERSMVPVGQGFSQFEP